MNQLAMQFRPKVSTTLTSYIELTESGAKAVPTLAHATSATEAARALIRHAHKHKALPLCGAWRLHPAQARLLEREAHGTPAGGWAAFTGVMAGTPMMQVVDAGFIPLITPNELDAWDDALIQRALIEALTVRLAPPITAAGIFVLTGLNPFAGLTVARKLHASLPSWSTRPDSTRARYLEQQLTGDPLLEPVAQMFFGAVAVLLEALATLRADRAYPIDALAQFVADVMRVSQLKLAACTAERLGLFLPGEPNRDAHLGRAMDFTALDLLDGFLIPAGLARRLLKAPASASTPHCSPRTTEWLPISQLMVGISPLAAMHDQVRLYLHSSSRKRTLAAWRGHQSKRGRVALLSTRWE